MKKTAIASVALAAALFAVSCQKENTLIENVSGPMTISAVAEGLNSPTKTQMIFKYDVAWSANDKIYVKDASGNNDTFSLTGGAGTTKGTFKQDGDATFTGEVQAYYPATMLQSGSPLWPASQTNDQTIPMYCKKTLSGTTDERMDFASLGSVLQIVFNTTQAGVTLQSIEIKDGSATLSGAFTVDTDGKAVITASDKAGITLDLGTGVALGKAANYFNIAVPAGNYQDLTLVFTATDGKKCTMTGGKVNIAYNAVGRLTLMGEKFKGDVPDGALPGKFSVSDTKKVHFSKSNLQATYNSGTGTYTFGFAANQYSYIGSAAGNTTIDEQTNGAVVDLFRWSVSTNGTATTNNYGIMTSADKSDYTGDFYDWGKTIGDGNTWNTLTIAEWRYLFNYGDCQNDVRKDKYKFPVTVCGMTNCTILLPDDWNTSVISLADFANTKEYSEETTVKWSAMEAAGAVCLPAAGAANGHYVNMAGDTAYYWSSSILESDNTKVYSVCCPSYPGSVDISSNKAMIRTKGFSVRLVTESK